MKTLGKPLRKLTVKILAEDSVQYDSPCLGQHGLSVLLCAEGEESARHVLVDVGQNSDALLKNMELMDVDPFSIDTIVLTHCHYDHTGGVTRILKAIGKEGLPVIAHPSLFRYNFLTDPLRDHVGVREEDQRNFIESAGGKLLLSKNPVEIIPALQTTGEIERIASFENKYFPLLTIQNNEIMPDRMLDDISLVANVEDKGLVIVTGCSHAGIINIAMHAMKMAKNNTIFDIIGGFHLVGASQKRIQETIEALIKINPYYIHAGHCTGFNTQAALHNAFSKRFEPLRTGMVLEI